MEILFMATLIEKQCNRFRLLYELYQSTNGMQSRIKNIKEIGLKIGVVGDDFNEAYTFINSEGLI